MDKSDQGTTGLSQICHILTPAPAPVTRLTLGHCNPTPSLQRSLPEQMGGWRRVCESASAVCGGETLTGSSTLRRSGEVAACVQDWKVSTECLGLLPQQFGVLTFLPSEIFKWL